MLDRRGPSTTAMFLHLTVTSLGALSSLVHSSLPMPEQAPVAERAEAVLEELVETRTLEIPTALLQARLTAALREKSSGQLGDVQILNSKFVDGRAELRELHLSKGAGANSIELRATGALNFARKKYKRDGLKLRWRDAGRKDTVKVQVTGEARLTATNGKPIDQLRLSVRCDRPLARLEGNVRPFNDLKIKHRLETVAAEFAAPQLVKLVLGDGTLDGFEIADVEDGSITLKFTIRRTLKR